MTKEFSIAEVEYMAFSLTRELMSFNEPIPDFSTRLPNILESCIVMPFQRFEKKSFYKGLLEQSAILFYLMIKNHPFQNGNKRIAIATLLLFFYKNNKWLKIDNKEFYNFAVWVAESPAKLKAETVKAVEKFIKSYLIVRKND